MTTTKSIAVTYAANELGLSEAELRELLKDYYKTHETIQRISTKNFAEIAQKLEESQDLSEPAELEVEKSNNEVQFEMVTPDAVSLESQEMNGNGHKSEPFKSEQDLEVKLAEDISSEQESHPTENTQEIEDNDFFSSQATEYVNTESDFEQENQQEQSRKQAQLQRESDMKLAWQVTATQASEFAESLEEGFWLIVAASRSSDKVQNSSRVSKARDLAMGIGDGGLQSSAHIKSVEKYLEDKGFFAKLPQRLGEPKQLTD